MEFGEMIGGIQTVDLLLVLYFMGFFVLGFAQGTIRRLIGIGSILFSFFFAANLAGPLGEFLGENWTQFPKEYSYMIGFLTIFVAAALAFALVAQGLVQAAAALREGTLRGRDPRRCPRCGPGGTHPRLPCRDPRDVLPAARHRPGSPGDRVPADPLGWSGDLRHRGCVPGHADPGVLLAHRVPPSVGGRGAVPQPPGLSVLDRERLAVDSPAAARRLLGSLLGFRDDASGRRVGLIVETEAYGGPEDLASHARFDSTRRNAVMAGPPGHAYVYLVYGMYDCLNVVSDLDGRPSAVLIRAIEPLEGIELMRADRWALGRRRRRARGPEVDRAARRPDRRDPGSAPGSRTGTRGRLFRRGSLVDRDGPVRSGVADAPRDADTRAVAGAVVPAIVTGPRVGVAYAGDWALRPWRFSIAGHPSVSRSR